MTPKEKANELVTIFLNITKRKLDKKGNYYDMDLAIECALATVNQATHITGAKYNKQTNYEHFLFRQRP